MNMKSSPSLRPAASMLFDDPSEYYTLDDMLVHLGEFGLYQKGLFMMLMPFCFFLGIVYFGQIFITLVPAEHWCELPDVAGVSKEDLIAKAIPRTERVPNEGLHLQPYSRCWIYDVPIDEIVKSDEPNPDWPMKKCRNWDFNYTDADVPYSTIATEQLWVCDDAYLANLAQSIFFVGSICGGFLFGWVADRYGRIPVLMCTNFMGFIGGIATVYATAFWQFALCRFVVGFAFDNTFVIMYILVLEYVGPKWRTYVANLSYGLFYTAALLLLPWTAYFIKDWRIFALATSIPLSLALLVPLVVPESVRWLISQNDLDKAVMILTRIEKVNRTSVPQEVYENFLDGCMEQEDEVEEERNTIIDLFKTPRLRRITIILTLAWSIMAMVYDGHIRALETLGLDVFTTFTVGAATELPAEIIIILVLDVWGRRWVSFGSLVLSGVAAFGACLVPVGIPYAAFAMVGRLFIDIATNVGTQYAAELLPTVVRGKGVAVIHNMGYVASILSPFVAYTSRTMQTLPMIILGILSFVAGILCLFLPETLKEELPQTLEDGEEFGRDQRFYDVPCLARKELTPLNRHHLHAMRPARRGNQLRSSMISGRAGNKHRMSTVRLMIDNAGLQSRKSLSLLTVASSPKEYLEKRRRKKERDEERRRKALAEMGIEEEVDEKKLKRRLERERERERENKKREERERKDEKKKVTLLEPGPSSANE